MKRLLRIVHVSRGLDTGGQERLLVEFARHADRSRFHLHFLSLSPPGVLADALTNLGWPVTAIVSPEGLRPRLILKLARFFRRERFDIVHTHDDRPLIYGAPAARLAGVGRLLHTHHHGPMPNVGPRQLLLVRLASHFTGRFVCVSNDSARYMVRNGVPKRKIVVLRNGIDLERFPYQGPDPAGPAVCVARLSPEKDIANLLRAAALLVSRSPDFRLEIAGDGPLRDDLHRLAAELNLGPTVCFLGEVRDIPPLLARARLFVLPSQTEGISLTILEAMARGLPVIASRVGGNPEVVLPDETGFMPLAKDPAALAAGLEKVWTDPSLGHRFGAAGRRRVEEHFDVRRMVRRYERLYDGYSGRLT